MPPDLSQGDTRGLALAQPRLVGVPAAARDLGISPRGLWALVAKKRVASVRIGKRVLIPRGELDRIAAEGVSS